MQTAKALPAARASSASALSVLAKAGSCALPRKLARSEPLRSQARSNSCSSLRPNSGLLSTHAKRQIVVRQQQGVGQRHQVHHGDMLGEHQPVGAGDRNLGILQRADDRLEQRPALAHQHQHVAGLAPALPSSASHARAIRRASTTRGLISLIVSNGASQPSISLRSAGSISGHSSTSPGAASGSDMCGGTPASSVVTLA